MCPIFLFLTHALLSLSLCYRTYMPTLSLYQYQQKQQLLPLCAYLNELPTVLLALSWSLYSDLTSNLLSKRDFLQFFWPHCWRKLFSFLHVC